MPKTTEELPKVELGQDSKTLLESTKSTIHGVADNVEEVATDVEHSKMTIQHVSKEMTKLRKEYELFRFEVRKTIADEVERQVRPLVEQMETFTTRKLSIVYIKWKYPFSFRFMKNGLDFLGFCFRKLIIDNIGRAYGKIQIHAKPTISTKPKRHKHVAS